METCRSNVVRRWALSPHEPTAAESQLIKDMIAEKIKELYGQTPQEFCEDIAEGPVMGGIK